MFETIYKKIKQDFLFLKKFEYVFSYIEHHNVMPSVVFRNEKKQIQIGMHYEDNKMFVIFYESIDQYTGPNLIQNIILNGSSYKEQVGQVQEFLKNYLENR